MGRTAAHETGHILGIADQYEVVTDPNGQIYSEPEPGWENNIMADSSKGVQFRNIIEILNYGKGGWHFPEYGIKLQIKGK